MTPVCQPVSETSAGPAASGWSTRTQIALAGCACAGGSAFLYLVDPNHHAVYPQCILYKTTGIYCAGCGATRALYALLHGNVLAALHDNVLFVGGLPFLAWWAFPHLMRAWRDNRWPESHVEGRTLARFGISTVLVMLTFMALRNLPGMPFDLLKPLAG